MRMSVSHSLRPMKMESESGSCDTVYGRVHKRTRSASPEGAGPSESRLVPEAVIQICLEVKGVRWDNGKLCYEVQDPVVFEVNYKELLQDKISEWTWNHLDKYYSLWESSRWRRVGSCFTPKDVHETKLCDAAGAGAARAPGADRTWSRHDELDVRREPHDELDVRREPRDG